MEVENRVAVVTGAASGIGRALCRAFAQRGARAVVVSDLDMEGAEAVAAELSGADTATVAVHTDVAREGDVQDLVRRSEERFGPVEMFCSNAGVMVSGGVDVSEESWDHIWAVNVKSHIYAARALLPGMLERGEGYLIHTASAAGLLTELGSAPYSVTKHAVVALAEWLSITYGRRGLRVSCLCPQAVWTGMAGAPMGGDSDLPGTASRSDDQETGEQPTRGTAIANGVLRAETVADMVLEAMSEERFLVLPHPEVATYEQRRAGDRERWLRGMRRAAAEMDLFTR